MLNESVNKTGWLWLAPDYFDKWRVFPRAFIIVYIWLLVQTALWFMGIPTPDPSQAAFASAVLGVGAAWFGLYVNSGPKNQVGALSPRQAAAIATEEAVAGLPIVSAPEAPPEPELTVTTTYRPRVISSGSQPTESKADNPQPVFQAKG